MKIQPHDAKGLFLAAIEMESPQERCDFLDRACAGNPELRVRVDELMTSFEQANSFLEQKPAGGLFPTVVYDPVDEHPGATIGPYKLLQQIGEGGFGVVYMAEQTQPVRRKVALKIIKPGMDTKEVIARFEAERQALALMDHPNIAKVLDGGATESGRPYFVMELVHGVPITEFCDSQKLSTRERLMLFADVCRAVRHAHQKGIIHRDLKPSNVMVTMRDDRAVPKIIDFGVSKALSQKLTEKTLFTAYGQMIGTPLYMSPEQAQLNEMDVDTRSDVYSLGVLLYELLTGSTPFDKETLKTAGFDELRKMIRETEPPRPSARISTFAAQRLSTVCDQRQVDPRKLSQSYRGELDWIVMKALEKDRNRRYESASAFAADVERYLNDEPVQACPPSLGYHLQKFARRNKTRIVVGSVIALALCMALGIVVQNRWESNRRTQDAVSAVERSLASARTAIGTRDIALAERHLADANARLDLTSAKSSEFKAQVGVLREDIKNAKDDARKFSQFVELARDGQDQMSATGDQSNEGFQGAQQALRLFGVLSEGDWADRLKQCHLSSAQQDQVRETAYETLLLLADHSVRWANLRSKQTALDGLNYLSLATRFHKPTKAFYWVRKEIHKYLKDSFSAERDEGLYEATPAQTAWDYYLPGHTAGWRGDREEAMRGYRRTLLVQPDHFNSLFFLAMRLGAEGRYEEAAQVYRACVALRPNHVPSLRNRSGTLSHLGRNEEALPLARKAVELAPASATAQAQLASSLAKQGNLNAAVTHLRKAIELDPKLANAHAGLGDVLREQGKLDEAVACYRKAIELGPKLAYAHCNLGVVLREQEKLDEAIACYRKAIKLDPKLAYAHSNLGVVLREQGKLDEAIACCHKAIELDPKLAYAHWNLGVVLLEQGKLDEAIACFRKAIELDPKFAPHTPASESSCGSRGNSTRRSPATASPSNSTRNSPRRTPTWA